MDYRYKEDYRKLCHSELIKKYEVSTIPYVDGKIVADACYICIKTLVVEFENLIKSSIKSTADVGFLLFTYSDLKESNPDNI